jgi:hypothetical protein
LSHFSYLRPSVTRRMAERAHAPRAERDRLCVEVDKSESD